MVDKQHLEELEQNDLQEFLANFGEWWSKHGTQTLLVILIGVGGFTGYNWWSGKALRDKEAAWNDMYAAGGPASLEQVASEHDDPGVTQIALLFAADQLHFDAIGLSPDGAAETAPDVTQAALDEATTEKLNKAAKLYQQVIDLPVAAGGPTLAQFNARIGLATVYTSLGDFDKARAEYDYVRTNAGEHRAIASLAADRYKELDTLTEPVVFPEPADPVESLGNGLQLESGAMDPGEGSGVLRSEDGGTMVPPGVEPDDPADGPADDDADANADEPGEPTGDDDATPPAGSDAETPAAP